MNLRKIISCLIVLVPVTVYSQLGGILAKKMDKALLMNAPSVGAYTLQDPQYRFTLRLKDGYPDERAAWIVYSDRANNITYPNPGNENQPFSALDFMQACFVIGEKGDYLELVDYVPGVNMSKTKKIVDNPNYRGWVHKSNLLLWNRALKDRATNYFIKAITAFGTERIFDILPQHVQGDSLLMFTSPFLSQSDGKCGMESIFYLYKESVTGNEYLVGPDPNFLPENAAKSGVGWISKDLVRVWGTQGFISLHADMEAHVPFFRTEPKVKDGQLAGDPVLVVQSPDKTPKSELERLYPILKYKTTNDGLAVVSTSFLADVLDKMNNKIYNISSEYVSNEDIQTFSSKSSILNIIIVAAGGGKNLQYFNNLQGILESAGWLNTAHRNFNQVNVGAVVYRDYGPNCQYAVTPLGPDLNEVSAFLSDQAKIIADGCDNGNYYQAVFGGVAEAARMMTSRKDESNIILLYGSGTDEQGNIGQAIQGLIGANARLFVFQTHNIPGEVAYRKFVEDAKDMISMSAQSISELKKRLIVNSTYPNVFSTSVGYTTGADTTGRVTFLNYPAKAITQGYILFPNDAENMPHRYLTDYLDSLIATIALDNRTIDNALHEAMAQAGSSGTKLKSNFLAYFPKYSAQKLPQGFLKANTLRNQKFLLPAVTVLAGNQPQSQQNGLSSGVLLSQRELTEFANQLALLGGRGVYNTKEAIYRQIYKAVEAAQRDQSDLYKPIKDLTFAEAMGYVTGYFPMDRAWIKTSLSQFKASDRIPLELGKVFLEESWNKASWLRDQYNNPELQFKNNGRTYYIIKEAYLPVNIAPDPYPVTPEPVVVTGVPASGTVVPPAGQAPAVTDKAVEKQNLGSVNELLQVIDTSEDHAGQTSAATDHAAEPAQSSPIPVTPSAVAREPIPTPAVEKENKPRRESSISDINDDLLPPTTAGKPAKQEEPPTPQAAADTVNYRRLLTTSESDNTTSVEPEKSERLVQEEAVPDQPAAEPDRAALDISDIGKDLSGVPAKERVHSPEISTPGQSKVDSANYWKELETQTHSASTKEPEHTPKPEQKNRERSSATSVQDITADLEPPKPVTKSEERQTASDTKREIAVDTINYRTRLEREASVRQTENLSDEKSAHKPPEVVDENREKDNEAIEDIRQDLLDLKKDDSGKSKAARDRRSEEVPATAEPVELKRARGDDINSIMNDLNNSGSDTEQHEKSNTRETKKGKKRKK